MIKQSLTILITFLLVLGCDQSKLNKNQDIIEVQRLKIFAKVYGYIKYFHPGDEAYGLDWDKFSIYSVNKILECKTNELFVKTIDSLFSPIAPSIRFTGKYLEFLHKRKEKNN